MGGSTVRSVTVRRGTRFKSVGSAAKWISEGRPVFMYHKYTHWGFAMQWKLSTISSFVSMRALYRATRSVSEVT